MKIALTATLALSLLASGSAFAQTPYSSQDRDRDRAGPTHDYRPGGPRWSRGDRLPPQFRQERYRETEWRRLGLRQPPRGYRWYRYGDNNYFLAAITTGLILETYYRDDRDQRWNQTYRRTYTYQDDVYYRECRTSTDPAGVLLGALIGGLIGNAAGDGRGSSTAAGVIIGGALGAAMTKDMDCEDRSYAYRSYYNGFNSGRPGARYSWTNPRTRHRGDMVIGNYYYDRSGFRCTTFTQTIYIQGRPQVSRGHACRQPDGTWAVVD